MKIKKYIPEILTVGAMASIPLGDYFIVKGLKEDDKKKLAAGYVLHGTSMGLILASNRVSNAQKASIIAAGLTQTATLSNYKNVVKEEVGEEKFRQIEEVYSQEELDRLIIEAEEANELIPDEVDRNVCYYFPQLPTPILIQCGQDTFANAVIGLNTQVFSNQEEATVNDFFWMIKRNLTVPYGFEYGWKAYDRKNRLWIQSIEVQAFTKPTRSGIDVTTVYFNPAPMTFDQWEEKFKSYGEGLSQDEKDKEMRAMDNDYYYALHKKDKEENEWQS